jgi:hypothetical protein
VCLYNVSGSKHLILHYGIFSGIAVGDKVTCPVVFQQSHCSDLASAIFCDATIFIKSCGKIFTLK